jgi:hypothetical protein
LAETDHVQRIDPDAVRFERVSTDMRGTRWLRWKVEMNP